MGAQEISAPAKPLRGLSDIRRFFHRRPGQGHVPDVRREDGGARTRARPRGLLPPAKLRQYLDDKVVTTRIAEEAGVECVPNVLAAVDSYELEVNETG
jgi:hypothetical protein